MDIACEQCTLYPWSYVCEVCNKRLCGNATCLEVFECPDSSSRITLVCESCLYAECVDVQNVKNGG